MGRTVLWYSYFWLFMLFSTFLLIPALFLYAIRNIDLQQKYTNFIVSNWARSLISLAGGKITVIGAEHLPETRNVCFIANHQGAFDIPIILAHLPGPVGFIAKKELVFLPIINLWMKGIGCIFIDRSNRRKAVNSIQRGVEQIRNGKAMIIFPEGTRSRGPQMNQFRHGSLKLAIRSDALIVPITISGSYKLKEENGRIQPASVKVTIHPPLSEKFHKSDDTRKLAQHLVRTISQGL